MSDDTHAPATILDHKLSFLSAQILALSAPMRVPSSYTAQPNRQTQSQSQTETREQTALRQASIDAALLKLNARLRQHSKQVYGQVAKRHVAEQVEGLYLGGADEEDGDGDALMETQQEAGIEREMKVLDKGADYATTATISLLPSTWPGSSSSTSLQDPAEAKTYEATVDRLQGLDARRSALQTKLAHYRALKAALVPYDSPTDSVQENLVSRGGEIELEMERMRVLVGRVVGRIGGVSVPDGREEVEDEEDDVMGNLEAIMGA